jgi:hypothetical protein
MALRRNTSPRLLLLLATLLAIATGSAVAADAVRSVTDTEIILGTDPALSLAVRLDTAAKAARFERPMLSASNVRVISSVRDLSNAELEALVAEADADAKLSGTRH